MSSLLPMLIQLTEKDKRLLIALFILFIVIFVLIAYIANGIKALMRKYSKGIDGYMHDLCKSKLVKTPEDFRKQVYLRETKSLYLSTRWAFRIGLGITALLFVYAIIFKPSDGSLFGFFTEALNDLSIKLEWPRGEFFGIENFPVDWPVVSSWPSPQFKVSSILTYASVIGYGYVAFVLFTSVLKFIARLHRGKVKSVDVFNKSLDNIDLDEEILNGEK